MVPSESKLRGGGSSGLSRIRGFPDECSQQAKGQGSQDISKTVNDYGSNDFKLRRTVRDTSKGGD